MEGGSRTRVLVGYLLELLPQSVVQACYSLGRRAISKVSMKSRRLEVRKVDMGKERKDESMVQVAPLLAQSPLPTIKTGVGTRRRKVSQLIFMVDIPQE